MHRVNRLSLNFFCTLHRGVISFLLLLCLLGTLIDLYHKYRVSHIPKLVHRIDSTGSFFCKIHKENQVAKIFTWWAPLISSLTLALFFSNIAFLFPMGAFFPSLTLVLFFLLYGKVWHKIQDPINRATQRVTNNQSLSINQTVVKCWYSFT